MNVWSGLNASARFRLSAVAWKYGQRGFFASSFSAREKQFVASDCKPAALSTIPNFPHAAPESGDALTSSTVLLISFATIGSIPANGISGTGVARLHPRPA